MQRDEELARVVVALCGIAGRFAGNVGQAVDFGFGEIHLEGRRRLKHILLKLQGELREFHGEFAEVRPRGFFECGSAALEAQHRVVEQHGVLGVERVRVAMVAHPLDAFP